MRIPLDYYQILGVPIQATSEQIQQAFEDRYQQLPRQEYSQSAIEARNQLLEDAHAVLSHSDQRLAYDAKILAAVDASPGFTDLGTTEATAVGVNLPESLLAGALILLHDLGAYDLITQLGETYLNRDIDLSHLPTDTVASDADVVLAMALAHLESGRDYWRQSQFQSASSSFQSGVDLLLREQLFIDLQTEFQTEFAKLRPYMILDLFALPLDAPEREQGFALLQDMLQERGGLDGSQVDHSGLDVDDFLRFVQQIRSSLTVAEQQTLFAPDDQHPSDVASFLSVYAWVAGGVVQRKPAQIQQAKALLTQLTDHQQDLFLEQSMCDLLLGQPEPALQTLGLSQDQESLAFIHQYSQGSEDLVPGLFLYTERWLQQEVYPYFRDLKDTQTSLQEYFNDDELQAQLSQLLPVPEPMPAPAPVPISPLVDASRTQDALVQDPTLQLDQDQHQEPQLPPSVSLPASGGIARMPLSPFETTGMKEPSSGDSATGSTLSPQVDPAAVLTGQAYSIDADLSVSSDEAEVRSAAVLRHSRSSPSPAQRQRTRSSRQHRRWLPWAGALLLGMLGVGTVMAVSQNWRQKPNADPSPVASPVPRSPSPDAIASPPIPEPQRSPVNPSNASSPTPRGLSEADALKLVRRWQQVKASALGKQHDDSQLSTILAEPIRSVWQDVANDLRSNQKYWIYTLDDLDIKAVTPTVANEVTVLAQVKETAQSYQGGVLQPDSYTDNYPVQYDLVREDNQWLIKDMK